MSGEIESLVEESPYPIQDLSKLLLDLGFKFLTDFAPNPNCQIVIYNTQKYNALPKQTKDVIDSAFQLFEKSMEIYVKDNQAIASEFSIIEKDSG